VSGRGGARTPSPWHLATAAIGLVLLLATIAFLVRDGVVRRRTPYPALGVSVDTVVATAGGTVVRVRVRNDGGVAAANVRVEGVLHGARGVEERAETAVDFVPPGAPREAGLVFAADPRAGRLDVRATAFDIP